MDDMMNIDVVIIGTGRVGLTLGFMLAKVGLKVVGIDKNKSIIEKINKNEMPFHEPKFDEIIKEVDFSVREDYGIISKSKNVIISIGTPLLPNIEADFSQLNSVMNELVKNLVEFQNIIIRSTVAPKTMEYIKNYLEKNTNMKVGENLFLSFAPERVAEGKIWDELQNLPQIIGVEDEKSFKKANEIFQLFTKKIFKTNYLSAELVKLFNNSSRYVNFAISNYYAIIAEKFNQDIYEILKMANYDYPRGEIPSPGLTSGTCLRKDFGFISETFPFSDIFLSSWRINEYMPKFIVDSVCNKVKIQNRNVTILGYTFKQDSDDIRDSLVPKLIRYIKKELPDNIFVVEPNLDLTDEGYENCLLLDAVKKGDIIFITIPHSEFIDKNDEIFDLAKDDAYFIDIWNVMNKNKIFFKKWMEL